MRVLVTRPAPQAGKWVSALRAAGLDAMSLPLIEIVGTPDRKAVLAAWQRMAQWDALMFVSANAVEHFFTVRALLSAPVDVSATRFFATGPGTVAALLQAGVLPHQIDAPDHCAAQFDSEALWQVVHTRVQAEQRVLIVRGNDDAQDGHIGDSDGNAALLDTSQGVGRDWFAARLRERGVLVEFVVTYVRRAPQLGANARALLQLAAQDGSVWLFSSSQALTHLCGMAPGQSWAQARAVATHPRIAEAARAAGFGRVCASRPALAELIASIESLA